MRKHLEHAFIALLLLGIGYMGYRTGWIVGGILIEKGNQWIAAQGASYVE